MSSKGASNSQFGGTPVAKFRWAGGVWVGKLKLQPPPELISPANNPTNASRVHCPKRRGRKSCCLVCSKAGVRQSTAEIGTSTSRRRRDDKLSDSSGQGRRGEKRKPELQKFPGHLAEKILTAELAEKCHEIAEKFRAP